MDPVARSALLSVPPEALEVATPEELAVYQRALELHLQLLSPLDVAVACSKARRYPHQVLLNRWIMALMDGRLYFDGPGPEPVPLTRDRLGHPSVAVLVAGYAGEEMPAWLDEATAELIRELPEGQAFDEDGLPILVHPTRGDRPVYNLAVSMPPRHGKSFLVSEHLPVWFLSNFPQYSVLLSSYEASFAATWGAKVRDHLCNHPEFGIEVVGGKNASRSHFELDGSRGFMKCAGAGGPLTGLGGQLMICDDPIKNAEDALSEIERENNGNWWDTTFYTRREPWDDGTPARTILMSTRWHEDDIHGRKVPEHPSAGDRWAKINLMAIFEPTEDESTDPLGRREGQALCPHRVPKRELLEIRAPDGSGEQWFQAMYQGHPSIEEGNLIKRPFNYYTLTDGTYELAFESGEKQFISEDECYRFATLDTAASEKTTADWTVFMVFDVTRTSPRRLLLRGRERVRIDVEDHEAELVAWHSKWRTKFVAIEDKTFGKNLIKRIVRKNTVSIHPLSADQDKIMRALPCNNAIRNEILFFPRDAEWLNEFEREVLKFPNAKHDDQVDTLAYGVQVHDGLPPHLTTPPEDHSLQGRVEKHRKELARRNKKQKRGRYNVLGRW